MLLGGWYADLLRHVLHVLSDEVIACRVEEDGEAPRVAESDHVGLAREELDVEHAEQCYLLSRDVRLVDALA